MWGQSSQPEPAAPTAFLEAHQRGDPEAKARLLESQRPFISAYIGKRARSQDDRDDLVQNVFLRATRSFESFRSDCPFSQWMLRIAANELKNYYERDLSRRPDSLEEFDWEKIAEPQHSPGEPGPYQKADGCNFAEKLIEIAKQVCREEELNVLMMVYQEETFEEIASLLELKAATVRSHFLRARTKLLAHLVAHEPELVGGVEAIRAAQLKAELDDREADAMRGDGGTEAFRSACLKLARFLPIPLLLILGENLWTKI